LLAEIYHAAGKRQRAAILADQVLRDAPDTAEAWYLRSFTTFDLQRALQYADKALTRRPAHVLSQCRRAHLRLQTGDLAGAIKDADMLMEIGENPLEWTIFKGHALARQGHFRQAIEQYTQALALRPQTRIANLYRAHAYRRVNEHARAVEDYTVVLESADETVMDVWIYYQRATPLWILGRAEEALTDYERVRGRLGEPGYADAREYIILREQDRARKADTLLAAALQEVQDPWLRQIFRCLAKELSPEALVAEAISWGNPEHVCEAQYYAGEVCLLTDRPAEARAWFEQCLRTGVEFDPDTALAVPMNEYELAHWRLEQLRATQP
jgi:tetratricopeptide (TPR) repeat protein